MGKHSIIVIKKDNKYLQYYEPTWDSLLFLNNKLVTDNNKSEVIKKVCDTFNLNKNDIIIKYYGELNSKKLSIKDNIIKEYTHLFYKVDINKELELDSNIYKWLTYDELLNDKRIMTVNSDIVNQIKKLNL